MLAFSVHEIDPRKACRIPYRLKDFSQNDDYINVRYATHNRSRSEHLNESAKIAKREHRMMNIGDNA